MSASRNDDSEVARTRPRLMIAVTHPITARYLMAGQLGFLQSRGFDVSVVCAPGNGADVVAEREGVKVMPVPMAREMSPLADLRALKDMVTAIRSLRPDIVNAGTPKAGLLGMLGARIVGVPVRIYTLRGLRLETASYAARQILTATEKAAAWCAHRVVCVSESLRERAVELGLVPRSKTVVLGSGSSNGVDAERFRPASPTDVAEIRAKLSIPAGAPVIGFVGRFTRDKGIADLAGAFFGAVVERFPEARLLLLGDFEEGDPVDAAVRRRLEEDPRVVAPGFVTDTAPYYAAMDVLAFPSYREGFPNAPLEAAASGIPVAGFAATGTVDAVQDGVAGTLAPVGDGHSLGRILVRYLEDGELRVRHAAAGRARVEREFRRELVWQRLPHFYHEQLEQVGNPTGRCEP